MGKGPNSFVDIPVVQATRDSVAPYGRFIGTDVPAFVQLTGGFRAGSLSRPRVA